ncbi:MAG TPA: hypothetical protein VLZ11_06605 [Flavobacterium sp.]|nr:hypothetical protein [Flavobacterium sp.]
MNVVLSHISAIKASEISISGSKSESNRLLLLQAIFSSLSIENLSDADDAILMQSALQSKDSIIDIGHAGTAMRFLAAYFAFQENREVVLTGSERMKQRPIRVLVNALRELGASIAYLENEGFPPLRIIGVKPIKNSVSVAAEISSQYISALLLIAPKLENGLEITLEGSITSKPYIDMTLALLNEVAVKTSFKENKISILPKSDILIPQTIIVESDWSSASYLYSIVALSPIYTEIRLRSFKENSLQADRVLAEIYTAFGVNTKFNSDNSIALIKSKNPEIYRLNLDLKNSPDIAQTIAVTCFGLGMSCKLTGLHTLKIKETDRLRALKNEIEKLGGKVSITDNSLVLASHCLNLKNQSPVAIATYQDHRMAMAFAPLALKMTLQINQAEVVSKSYPKFWQDLETMGFSIEYHNK